MPHIRSHVDLRHLVIAAMEGEEDSAACSSTSAPQAKVCYFPGIQSLFVSYWLIKVTLKSKKCFVIMSSRTPVYFDSCSEHFKNESKPTNESEALLSCSSVPVFSSFI